MRIPTLFRACSPMTALIMPFSLLAAAAHAQDINLSQKIGSDAECAISKNPSNSLQLFALCNTTGPGLFAARSIDGGVTWIYPDPSDKTIADGDPGQGPAACCDPNLAWDTFGNLFLTYIDKAGTGIVTILSTDGGATFSDLVTFGPASVDQPSVVAANTSAPGAPVALWIVWNLGGAMVARGAAVTGLGTAGVAAFGPLQAVPGTTSCSFGDVAIAPSGVVVQTCGTPAGGQGPSSILASADTDGLGPINFGGPITATTTNVGGWDFIPPQNARSVDPEAGLAFDSYASSPHFGRLYLVYTEETAPENNDTDIMLRFSDDNGSNWSAPIRVNDDPTTPIRSQFLPKIAVNPATGDIAVCWHDARNSVTNTAVEEYCALATTAGAAPTFLKNAKIADGASTSPGGMEFGDYSGLVYGAGFAHPVWGDASNSTGNNPDGTSNIDSFTDRFVRPPTLSFCITHPTACDKPVLKPEHIQFACVKYPCIFQDFIPHNCLIKFVCPGCPPGALCPPYFTFGIEGLDPAWRVELYDPTGHVVAYEQRKTPRGTMISFRPAREYFKDGKIGDYFFTFETVDRAQLGREQSVRMTVQGGNEPFGSQQKLPR